MWLKGVLQVVANDDVLIWLHGINFDFFARYGSVTNPSSIEGDIQELLAA